MPRFRDLADRWWPSLVVLIGTAVVVLVAVLLYGRSGDVSEETPAPTTRQVAPSPPRTTSPSPARHSSVSLAPSRSGSAAGYRALLALGA